MYVLFVTSSNAKARKHNRKLFLIVCDQSTITFMHVICFDDMASEYDCGNEDTPQNSVSLMNVILGKYRTPNVPAVKFLITKSQFLHYNLILAMLQPLLLLKNVSDTKSVKSLDNFSLPSSSQQL